MLPSQRKRKTDDKSAKKSTVTAAVLCEAAVLAGTALYIANAPLSSAIRILVVVRQLGHLPCVMAGIALAWASASVLDHPNNNDKEEESVPFHHPLRRVLRRVSMPLHLWHLLFLVGGAALVAWMSATSLCDPLVRTAWLRARPYDRMDDLTMMKMMPPIRNKSSAAAAAPMSLHMEPMSVVTRPMRFPTFAFSADDDDAQPQLHVRLSFLNDANDSGGSSSEHCASNDTDAVRMGRRALTAGACVLMGALLIGAVLCHRYKPHSEAPPPPPASKMAATFVVRTLGAPISATTAATANKKTPARITAVAELGGLTVLFALGLSGLAVMGALNGDHDTAAEWDWRAFYLLLGASALAGYLIGGLAHLFLLPSWEDNVLEDVPVERALVTVWLSVPLLAAQAAHALLQPPPI